MEAERVQTAVAGPVVVTGAGSGIGKGCALLLAERGRDVVVTDVDADRARATAEEAASLGGGTARHATVDVSDPASCRALYDGLAADGVLATGLVNSAGVSGSTPFVDLTDEEWDRIVGINLTGTMRMSRLFAKALVDAERPGAIVNVASVMAHFAAPRLAPYAASKGGVAMLTRATAVELAPYGIRVNAVSPGYIETGMTAVSFTIPRFRDAILSRTPMGELGVPAHIAGGVAFLLSDDAAYVTGQVLPIDGGMTAGDHLLTSPTPAERAAATE
jgi:NAD(P)-dependent dehydrogenase (short-subunit alcohol dehydrogenase family)